MKEPEIFKYIFFKYMYVYMCVCVTLRRLYIYRVIFSHSFE